MNKQTYGITQLLELVGWNKNNGFLPHKQDVTSFRTASQVPDRYQEPSLSVQGGFGEKPKLILISAAGAVGKSTLTQYLSAKTEMPIFDLATNKPVGDCTMTGILAEVYDYSEIRKRLESGSQGIIIDALDEGYMKVSDEAFFSFIDDLLKYTNGCNLSTPFILLGRTNIIQIVKDYLNDKNINNLHLKIDPFTEQQAKDFLYRHIIGDDKVKYEVTYKETVDYLIYSIQGFFKSQGQIDQETYANFIGYAPVLLAIVEFLTGQGAGGNSTNFFSILNDLKSQNSKNVLLLIDLIDKILLREQRKVQDQLVKLITPKYSEEIKEKSRNCYSPVEQCVRLLMRYFDFNDHIGDIQDESFRLKYEEGLKSFFEEHPFLTNGSLNNVVFESYVLAMVASTKDYAVLAEEYVSSSRFKTSFALYPIITKIIERNHLVPPQAFLAPIYSSLTSQSPALLMTEVEIEDGCENNVLVSFKNETQGIDCELTFQLDSSKELNLGGYIGNASVSGDFNVLLNEQHMHIATPMRLECKELRLSCSDITITYGDPSDNSVEILCHNLISNTKSGNVVEIKKPDGIIPLICCPYKPSYPFSRYHQEDPYKKEDPNYEKFQKLRGIIQQFRAHGKGRGNWGKKKDKIYRRYAYGVGKDTLNALLSSGILYEDKHLYKMNTNKFQEILHLTYEEMLNGKVNQNVNEFLHSY